MPFLIDSVRMAINQREIGTHSIQHSILKVERDSKGVLKKLFAPKKTSKGAHYEAFIVLEIDRHSDPKDLRQLEAVLRQILHEVRIAVSDFPILTDKIEKMAGELEDSKANIAAEDREEGKERPGGAPGRELGVGYSAGKQ
jgi:glutamate dehydrogenase